MSKAVDAVSDTREKPQKRQDRQRQMQLIRKVLIANRGEIACRVMRTCRDMGIATVAVFSDADAAARHVREADEAVRIGEAAASESYLNIPTLIEAGRRTGADAVHPGYGFLAENADFAAACIAAGMRFIGPEPAVIASMGSKREAKLLMAAAGVPVVLGYEGEDQSDARLLLAAREIGYPVMVKASAGGGGKGMRVVASEADLVGALAGARREARSAFGDDTLILERAVSEPRHVEFQIFGDNFGNVIHLCERECTIQRRHQKIVEETPSTALSPELRSHMGEAAVTVGRALGYTNAGTVEFILDPGGRFYFLEVNTRLQVEHPVTELVTGLDLVRWQILVAEGRPLPLDQEEVQATGHAVEVRVYAEDPARSFLPSTGDIALWREPDGTGVRVDAGIQTGDAVLPYYDPLLAKISAYGADRQEALRRLDSALARTMLFGVRANLDYLRRVLFHPAHVAGEISTSFVERYAADLLGPTEERGIGHAGTRMAALVVALGRVLAAPLPGGWRNNRSLPLLERYDEVDPAAEHERHGAGDTVEVRLTPLSRNHFRARLNCNDMTEQVDVVVHAHDSPDLAVELDGSLVHATVVETPGHLWWVKIGDVMHTLRWHTPLPEPGTQEGATGSLTAPMPGQVVSVLVSAGQAVRAGDALLVLEAMKMEHTLRAPYDGTVAVVLFAQGDRVAAGAPVLEVQPVTETDS
jgi:acetyl-CoA carboxylase biotin carboxylase subunit